MKWRHPFQSVIINSLSLFAVTASGMLVVTAPQPAVADTKHNSTVAGLTTAGIAASSGVGALVGAGAPGAAAGAAVGGLAFGSFQVGYFLGCLIFDPPDPINAGIPVLLSDYLGYNLPDVETLVSGVPPSVANAANHAFNVLDSLVSYARATQESIDRYEGALLIGRDDYAAARYTEYLGFRAGLRQNFLDSYDAMNNFVFEADTYDMRSLGSSATLEDAKTVRDQLASGIFPDVDQVAVDSWALTTEEQSKIFQANALISDEDLQDMFNRLGNNPPSSPPIASLPARTLAIAAAEECSSTCVPAVPAPLPLFGVSAAFSFSRKIRNRIKAIS